MLPTRGLPLQDAVTILWDAHQVPYLKAKHDSDLATALGLVHAHLRLAQMEILRRVSQGRLSEMLGPAALDVDQALRILHFPRAVPAIAAALPAETRAWLEAFLVGVNHYVTQAPELPPEFALLGIGRDPWTLADLLTLGRLAAADASWIVWFQLLRLRHQPAWIELWPRLLEDGAAPVPSLVGSAAPVLTAWLSQLSTVMRGGSNALAVAPGRSATGAPWLAGDPHLSVLLPSLWLLAGYECPSYNLVGLMIPGLPFMAVGRNPWIAWGGTNLHAASSELFDISHLPPEAVSERRETLRVRWWPEQTVVIRETALGPVLSDARLLGAPRRGGFAIRWIGHGASDEFTAMLRINRARSREEFAAALDGFAIPGQNLIYADAEGHIGHLLAARLPRRPAGAPEDIVAPPAAARHWDSFVSSGELPSRFDPPAGFVASANDRPQAEFGFPVGFFFSPNDRVERIAALLDRDAPIGLEDLAALQQDVVVAAALELRDLFLRLARALSDAALNPERRDVLDRLVGWDGAYHADSQGALAYELLLYHLVQGFHRSEALAFYSAVWHPRTLIRNDIAAADPEALKAVLARALDGAAEGLRHYGSWGEMHRLGVVHLLGALPLVGRRYRLADLPAAGSSETLMKTAHPLSGERHTTRYGSNARYIFDLSDPDANHLVLFGGQDGWLGSDSFMDQVTLWQDGDYIRLPLRFDTARGAFPYTTELSPPGA